MDKKEKKTNNVNKSSSKEKGLVEGQEEEKIIKPVEPIRPTNNKKPLYISYPMRIIIYALLFLTFLGISVLLVYRSLGINEEKIVKYQENGNIDYKVYLKSNEFYEQPYLTNGSTVIAKLINNIELNAKYNFSIDTNVNASYNYEIIGKLIIDSTDKKRLFEKEYVLLTKKFNNDENVKNFSINETVNINYDYYNSLANSFRTTFGVDTINNLDIYVRINKEVNNENKTVSLVNSNQMTLNIPLTEKTINISISNTGIKEDDIIIEEKRVEFGNITLVIIAVILFICSVCMLLKALELLQLMFKNDSKYDKYIRKILNEYDRLIVETETAPDIFDNKVIKVKKFQEMLDVRDNVKKPIMYYIVHNHQKCYFYIQSEKILYILTVKAIDLGNEKVKENKKSV